MNPPPGFPAGDNPPPPSRPELQLRGPRPSPLSVRKESHQIRKPPLHPYGHHHPLPPFRPPPPPEPVIIYSVSPKVIHVQVDDFMKVVQRLTGPSSPAAGTAGDVSPAARLAAIEKTSPSEKEKERFWKNGGDDDMMMDLLGGVEVSQFHGILSPAPATLPEISTEFFSPANDPEMLTWLHDMSPFWSAGYGGSPSGLFPTTIASPLPSPDVFSIFDL